MTTKHKYSAHNSQGAYLTTVTATSAKAAAKQIARTWSASRACPIMVRRADHNGSAACNRDAVTMTGR